MYICNIPETEDESWDQHTAAINTCLDEERPFTLVHTCSHHKYNEGVANFRPLPEEIL